MFRKNGGLAQLARAFAWHAKGHRFDSGNLHIEWPISLSKEDSAIGQEKAADQG